MRECKHCGYQIQQDETGDWYDPDATDPWDYDCVQFDGPHEPKVSSALRVY